MKRLNVPIDFDSCANMAYLNFEEPAEGETVGPGRTVHVELPRWARGSLVIDFDAQGRIVGFEFLNVPSQFRPNFVGRLRSASESDKDRPQTS